MAMTNNNTTVGQPSNTIENEAFALAPYSGVRLIILAITSSVTQINPVLLSSAAAKVHAKLWASTRHHEWRMPAVCDNGLLMQKVDNRVATPLEPWSVSSKEASSTPVLSRYFKNPRECTFDMDSWCQLALLPVPQRFKFHAALISSSICTYQQHARKIQVMYTRTAKNRPYTPDN